MARAALWNLVIPSHGRQALANDQGAGRRDRPGRCLSGRIILCLDDARRRRRCAATIESNVISQPGGGRIVYSEEITLVGPTGAEAHFGALVRALQVPGVRTATFWMDPVAAVDRCWRASCCR